MSIKRMCTICILGCFMLAIYGCGKPTIMGSDAAVYSGGRLYAVTSHDLDSVYRATLDALGQLEIEVTEEAKDVFCAKVMARAADGKKITIWIEPGPDDTCEFSIKTGGMGNRERSSIIYKQIQQNLGTGSSTGKGK